MEGLAEPRVSWSVLSYRINKMMLSVDVEVEAAIVPAWSLLDDWIDSPEGVAVRGGGREVLAVQLRTEGLGQSSVLDLWADPHDWAALQRWSIERGRGLGETRYRGYRFLDLGVFSRTRYPTTGEAGRSPSEWSEIDEELLRLPSDQGGRFIDPTALFWIVSTLDPTNPEEGAELRIWLRRGVFHLEIKPRELTQLRVDYMTATQGGEQRNRSLIPVRRYSLTSRPIYTDRPQKSFRFAGLSGDIDVFVDVQNRIPVQISGSLRPLGRGHLKLKRVIVRQ